MLKATFSRKPTVYLTITNNFIEFLNEKNNHGFSEKDYFFTLEDMEKIKNILSNQEDRPKIQIEGVFDHIVIRGFSNKFKPLFRRFKEERHIKPALSFGGFEESNEKEENNYYSDFFTPEHGKEIEAWFYEEKGRQQEKWGDEEAKAIEENMAKLKGS